MKKNKKIMDLLFERGWSQRELSRRANVPETKLSTIINGWVNPSEEYRKRIAEALGSEPQELFEIVR